MTKTYELTWRPLIQAMVTPELAEAQRRLHPMRQQYQFFSHKNPLFSTLDDTAASVRAQRAPAAPDNPFVQVERLCADSVERSLDLWRDMRDAAIELGFHAFYGSPWMRRVGSTRLAPPQAHDLHKLPHVREAIDKARTGGYAEGIVRMLVLLARARGSVRRDRLERSNRLLHDKLPFSGMTEERRSRMIHEQSVIVEFAGDEAITALADLLPDPVDRYRALNFVLEVTGAVEDMDPPTVAMFRRFHGVLLTLGRDWRDPDLGAAA